MGRSNTTLRGPLASPEVRADDSTLTSFAGLIPFIKFLNEMLEIPSRLAVVVDYDGRKRTYAIHQVLNAFLVCAVAGIRKLAHIEAVEGDAVLLKFLRMPSWPVRKVFSKALAGLDEGAVSRLQELLTTVGLWSVDHREECVLDFDSSTIISFGQQEGAVFGYCGKGRNRRRHHPLVSSLAETRAVIHADYRDGSAIPADETIAFICETVRRVRDRLAGCLPTIRADSGFWSKAVGAWLLQQGLPFVMAMPLAPAVKLMMVNAAWHTLEDEPDIQLAVIPGDLLNLDPRLRVVAIRRFVHDPKAPPQGKRIQHDPRWRYQALITSLDWEALDVWRFYNDRADCERIFKIAKGALGMNWLVGHDLTANSVAFYLRLLAYNADLLYQRNLERRARAESRPLIRMGLLARQNRFYRKPGRLLREHNRWLLRVPDSKWLRRLWVFHAPMLVVRS
jgi:hypothetical protein